MQLTPEQLEKAAQIAYETWYKGYQMWEDARKAYRQDMRDAVGAAFAAVEPPKVDVPGDLHKKAEIAAWEALGHGSGLVDSIQMMTIVGTVLRVALEDPRVLGEPKADGAESLALDNKCFEAGVHVAVKQFLASRRARLVQPKTVEERVTISHQEGGKCFVCVDGEALVELLNSQYWIGEAVKDGLIAKLKDSGITQREAAE